MRTFLSVVIPISVFLFVGYLWSVQGRESMIVLQERADKAESQRLQTPLASAMPDYVASRAAGRRADSSADEPIEMIMPSGLAAPQPAARGNADSDREPQETTSVVAASAAGEFASAASHSPTPAAAVVAARPSSPSSAPASDETSDETPGVATATPTQHAEVAPRAVPRNLWERRAKSTLVRPHLLIVVVEDLNREDLGCYGQTLIRTPRIDKLALDGLRLTQFAGMSSGQYAQRTSLIFGDLTMAAAVGSDRLVKLPQLSLPRMLSVSGYSTILLGDCSWQLVDDPEQGHWQHYWGWGASGDSVGERPGALVEFAVQPTTVECDGARASVVQPDGKSPLRFDAALVDQAGRFADDGEADRPIALFVALRLSWWTQAKNVLPEYASTNWTEAEKLHASAVTSVDRLIGELVQRLQARPDRGPAAAIVVGLPRELRQIELERFRAAAPSLTRRGGMAPAGSLAGAAAAPPSARPFGPKVAQGTWPLAPAIIAWPEHIRAGESDEGFTGFHDLVPTLAAMIDARQTPLAGIMGSSHWKRWQLDE